GASRIAQRVKATGFDNRFNGAFIADFLRDFLEKVLESCESTLFFSGLDHPRNSSSAHITHRSHAKSDIVAYRCAVLSRFVSIWRQYSDIHMAAFIEI